LKIRSILTVAAGVALVGLVAGPAEAAAPPPVDVSQHSVTCDAVYGSAKFSIPLTLTGPTSNQNNATTLSLVLDGCADDNDAFNPDTNTDGVALGQSKGKGILTSGSANCTALLGVNPVTTTDPVLIKWKGLTKMPNPNEVSGFSSLGKLSSDATGDPEVLGKGYRQLSVTAIAGGTYDIPDGGGINWGEANQYGMLQVGADADHQNTPAPSSTGAFGGAGGSNGAGTTLDAVTSGSAVSLLAPCTGSGLKSALIGLGQAHFG
jgi:hypothetical protein